ncbi:hypothetical protein BD324DRAFT_422242 [Kockovaella imperatae]|uniref:Uncharacterized protein n=1 Tax=Kockovaella imperatae TaxID=4999 RepID=A0A1Y1UHM2_9TREE|nr:hypothetical protein BD324DRAFT_422242 [Kockovaella imperatae]ORX37027.1 hypothetical protein BD324DRAFT_422242 [Kockovaella imperatae]
MFLLPLRRLCPYSLPHPDSTSNHPSLSGRSGQSVTFWSSPLLPPLTLNGLTLSRRLVFDSSTLLSSFLSTIDSSVKGNQAFILPSAKAKTSAPPLSWCGAVSTRTEAPRFSPPVSASRSVGSRPPDHRRLSRWGMGKKAAEVCGSGSRRSACVI